MNVQFEKWRNQQIRSLTEICEKCEKQNKKRAGLSHIVEKNEEAKQNGKRSPKALLRNFFLEKRQESVKKSERER